MEIKVNAEDIVRWARLMDNIPRVTKPAIARALNAFGDNLFRETVRVISDKYDWDPDEVANRIAVEEADPRHLTWAMDASLVLAGSNLWDRPFPDRDMSEFEQNTLVNIVTSHDGSVCPVCQEAAARSPYTMSQVLELQARWAEYVPPTPNIAPGVITNLIHPRCRCVTQSWNSYRRLPVSFTGGTDTAAAGDMRAVSARQLAQMIKDELLTSIRRINITTA